MQENQGSQGNRGVAVAMGGGVPFGVIALGLLRLLEEKQVPVRVLGGTSMGAIVSALYSRNPNAREVEETLAEFFDHLHPKALLIRDLSLFRPGLFRGTKLMDRIEELMGGDFLLEEAPIPLVINATDLIRGSEVVLRSGSARVAIRASISMPGIFVPKPWQDTYLVDGGITCPVPARALEGCGFPVIPVRALRSLPSDSEVGREKEHFEKEQELHRGKAPAIVYVMWRALGLIQQDDYSRQLMEQYPHAVAPRIPMEMSGDLKKIREIVQSGYEEARKQWPRIEALLD